MCHGVNENIAVSTSALLNARQFDDESRAARRIFLHADASLMLGDDSADDRQPQSRAAFAGGKIWLEDSFAVLGRDAGAGVGDDQLKTLSLRDFARDDGDSAISGDLGHRFGGVVNQVYQRAFDLFAIDHYGGQRGRERRREPDAVQSLGV